MMKHAKECSTLVETEREPVYYLVQTGENLTLKARPLVDDWVTIVTVAVIGSSGIYSIPNRKEAFEKAGLALNFETDEHGGIVLYNGTLYTR